MTRRTTVIAAFLCLMAMSFFAARPFWKWVDQQAASALVHRRAQDLVDKNLQLRPAWEIALQDGVLTLPEARVIIEAAGETIDIEAAGEAMDIEATGEKIDSDGGPERSG